MKAPTTAPNVLRMTSSVAGDLPLRNQSWMSSMIAEHAAAKDPMVA